MSKKKKQREQQQNQEEAKAEANSATSNHKNHIEMTEKRIEFTNPSKTMSAPVDARTEPSGGHFRCPECRGEEHVPNPIRWEHMNGRTNTLEDRERQRIRVEEENRRRTGPPQRIMGREAMNAHLVGNSLDLEGQNRQDLVHCGSCHRTYRSNQMDQNTRQGRLPPKGNSGMHGFQQQRNWERNSFYSDFDIQNLKRETRNVTFALESPRKVQGEDGESEGTSSPRQQDRSNKLQANKQIKVKLNLNPLRKSKVHPKSDKGSPRKSKDKSESKKHRKKSKEEKKEKNTNEKETVAQIAPQNPMAHMQGFLGAQFRGGGMLLGNRSNLLGSSGPQLLSSGLPFQAGNVMGKPMFPTPNPMGSNINMSGPSMGPGGTSTMGLMNSSTLSLADAIQPAQANLGAASLLASPNSQQANIMQASPTALPANANRFQSNVVALQPNANLSQANPTMPQGNTAGQANSSTKQASPTTVSANVTSQTSSAAKQASPTTLSANSSSQNLQALATLAPPSSATPSGTQSESKSPKSSPRGQPKSAQETVPQSNDKTIKVTNPVTSETPASPRKGSQTPIVTESSQTVAPQNTPVATMVKNMSSASLSESTLGEALSVVTKPDLPTGG
ncbi:hypothetical protein WMY93_001176 [Mugilogobius chulae]|uniref:Uncharacterized protein n=1 Tax=Mugilogobius chulae TaxID=88201 RepID=A0AAW0Q326_9GOBI